MGTVLLWHQTGRGKVFEDLLTIGDVAAATRTPTGTLRYWRHIGAGPKSFKPGRRVVYRKADLEAWLREQYDANCA